MNCLSCTCPTQGPLCSHCDDKRFDLSPVVYFFVDTPDGGMEPGRDCTYVEVIPWTFGDIKATVTPPVIPV